MYYMPYGDDDAAENEAEHGDPNDDGDALYMSSPEEKAPKGLGANKAGKDVGRSPLLSKIVVAYLLLTILSFALAAIL